MTDEHVRWARLPRLNGLPLKAVVTSDQDKRSIEVLSTLDIHKIKLSDVNLTCPSGLKKVNNITAVVSAQSDSFMKDVVESLK